MADFIVKIDALPSYFTECTAGKVYSSCASDGYGFSFYNDAGDTNYAFHDQIEIVAPDVQIPDADVPVAPEPDPAVHHPSHYGGADNPYETIKVVEAWGLNFNTGNAVKYISRAGKKSAAVVEDLKKAIWYLNREVENLSK